MNTLQKIRIALQTNKVQIAVPGGDYDEKLLSKILVQSGLDISNQTGTDDLLFTVPLDQLDATAERLKGVGLPMTIMPRDIEYAPLRITYST